MSNRYWISVGAIAVVAALAGVYVARMLNQPAVPSLESGTSLPQARVLPEFNLVDTQGKPASPAALRGHPTLVFFGFTHCPDVCPTTLALLANVQKQVAQQDPALSGIKVALISVDPERDTPEQLGSYIASFRGDLIGLTGSASEIVKATSAFGVGGRARRSRRRQLHHGPLAAVFVLDSQARIVAVFTPPLSAAALGRDLARLTPVLNPRA
jgi:protein SCO1/2